MGRGSEVTVTNDGATILKAIYIDNPAAKVLVGEFRGCMVRSVCEPVYVASSQKRFLFMFVL